MFDEDRLLLYCAIIANVSYSTLHGTQFNGNSWKLDFDNPTKLKEYKRSIMEILDTGSRFDCWAD